MVYCQALLFCRLTWKNSPLALILLIFSRRYIHTGFLSLLFTVLAGATSLEDRGIQAERFIYTPDEDISLSLEYLDEDGYVIIVPIIFLRSFC